MIEGLCRAALMKQGKIWKLASASHRARGTQNDLAGDA